MNGTRLIVVAALICAVARFAASTEFILKANFVEVAKENSSTQGVLYYYYNDANDGVNSRLRMEYSLPGGYQVNNLYDYHDKALYSMCTGSCTGRSITERPDPWYVDNNVYNRGQQEGSGVWFNHKPVSQSSTFSAQVKRILMKESYNPHADIYKIDFQDGRNLTLSQVVLNPNGINKDSSVFKKDSGVNCPSPTCPIYADMVFVLDNSLSLDDGEWGQQVNFVKKVMESFTFSNDGVMAAAIHFNGPTVKKECTITCHDNNMGKCDNDHEFNWGYNCWWGGCGDFTFPGFATADFFASDDAGAGQTVTADLGKLKRNIDSGRPFKVGYTCQGFGLELAMKAFDRSPRRSYIKKPARIVISVTDGNDNCPIKTRAAAEKLKKEYDAFIVEIGVGMDTMCDNRDRKYLESIASKMGSEGTPAYYPVNDYNSIGKIVDQLFRPICDDFNTDCGPDCLGFCGCGKCYCPKCKDYTSSCYSIGCTTDKTFTTSTGCEFKDIPCPKQDDVCVHYKCNDNIQGDGRCTPEYNQCTELKNKIKGTCRSVDCNPSSGGCYVKKNNDYCNAKFGSKCVQFECTPENEQVPAGYEESGCRPVEGTDLVKKYQEELNKQNKWCVTPVCDPQTGTITEKDTCTSGSKCYNATCKKQGNSYQCQNSEKNRPKDDACTTYKCVDSQGWVPATQKDRQTCIREKGKTEEDYKCYNVYCDAQKGGCQYDKVPTCDDRCSAQNITKCIAEALAKSDVKQCKLGQCTIDGQGQQSRATCVNPDYIQGVNCIDTLRNQIEQENKNHPERCYTAECGTNGQCAMTYTLVPDSMAETKCKKPVCKFNGNDKWEWTWGDTQEKTECVSDECFARVCDDEKGCVASNTCSDKSNECTIYSCDYTSGSPKCVSKSAAFDENECQKEECVNGVNKSWVLKNLTVACPTPDKCHEAACEMGKCVFVEKKYPDDDPCTEYDCNPETGEFTPRPKCDDGLYCTENQCTVQGECKFSAIICSDQMDMSGYPCFEARCQEDADAKKYKCVRKLIRNAYIDVCGNCIKEEQKNVSTSSETNEVDTLSCTGAPAKPILTEGLAAASIALIIIAAVIVGAAIAASSVMGTKTLINRARGAGNQSAHSNPLFEGNDTELTNPTYAGTV